MDNPFTGSHPGRPCDENCYHNWLEIPKAPTHIALDTITLEAVFNPDKPYGGGIETSRLPPQTHVIFRMPDGDEVVVPIKLIPKPRKKKEPATQPGLF